MSTRLLNLPHQEGKRGRTRARLTNAALRLMSERGINATSVSEIAAAAELANGTFYLYFKDKSEIVAAVCQAVTLAMHNEMSSTRLALVDGAARVAFGTYQFIEIAAAEPVWGHLIVSAFTEFKEIKEDISRYMRLDVALGIKQGRFSEPVDEFVIDSHLAILRAAVTARLKGAGQDVAARAAEYQLRILGIASEEARQILRANEQEADGQEDGRPGAPPRIRRTKPAASGPRKVSRAGASGRDGGSA